MLFVRLHLHYHPFLWLAVGIGIPHGKVKSDISEPVRIIAIHHGTPLQLSYMRFECEVEK